MTAVSVCKCECTTLQNLIYWRALTSSVLILLTIRHNLFLFFLFTFPENLGASLREDKRGRRKFSFIRFLQTRLNHCCVSVFTAFCQDCASEASELLLAVLAASSANYLKKKFAAHSLSKKRKKSRVWNSLGFFRLKLQKNVFAI